MKRLVVIMAIACSGCAIGRVSSDGELVGVAVGRAKLEHCEASTDGAKPRCDRIQGGPLSSGLAELIESAVVALGAWFGAVP